MPKRPEILYDASKRVRVRTVEQRFPFPMPNGWFAIAVAGELGPGDTRALHYFDMDLVAWADADGQVHLTEAYCPHQGAHLAVGGRVEDVDGQSCLRCPFHGWAFTGEGDCAEIPYGESERIPARANLRTFPVVQRGPYVWAWYHAEQGEPFYEVPEIPEFTSDEWMDSTVRDFEVATCAQEMAENNHDFAHFKFVHGTEEIPEGEEIIDGYYKATKNPGLERETFGLGLGVVRVPGAVTFCSSVTPIDAEHVHVRWAFTSPAEHGQDFLEQVALRFTEGVSQDIEIWENKVFRPRPVLVKGESGIIAHRNWAAQFYSADHVELPDEV
jgi:phenylpropionate dioxygenase-like ring-hydroxylating dioxygenase large terminal subunit